MDNTIDISSGSGSGSSSGTINELLIEGKEVYRSNTIILRETKICNRRNICNWGISNAQSTLILFFALYITYLYFTLNA